MLPKIKTIDRFLAGAGVLKKAVIFAGAALAATLATAGYAQPYFHGPRIIHIPEREAVSSNDDLAPPRQTAPSSERRGNLPALFDGPTPIRPLPRFKGAAVNTLDGN